MLNAAEEKWAPPDDPVFQLIPLDFKPYVTRCFEELGKPVVDFHTFWDVYCKLRDLVEITVPDVVVETLSESITDDSSGVSEPFAFAHLKKPVLGDIVVDEVDEGEFGENEDEGEVLHVDFTNEEDRDELY